VTRLSIIIYLQHRVVFSTPKKRVRATLHPVVLPPRRSARQNHGLACRQVGPTQAHPFVPSLRLQTRLTLPFPLRSPPPPTPPLLRVAATNASYALSCAASLPLRLILTAQCRLPLLAAPSSPTSLSYAIPTQHLPPRQPVSRRATPTHKERSRGDGGEEQSSGEPDASRARPPGGVGRSGGRRSSMAVRAASSSMSPC
jgi:hypothetical protein